MSVVFNFSVYSYLRLNERPNTTEGLFPCTTTFSPKKSQIK